MGHPLGNRSLVIPIACSDGKYHAIAPLGNMKFGQYSNSLSNIILTASGTATDTTPDAFSFVDQTNVAINTTITSAPITITGISAGATITVTNGTYDINGSGVFTSSPGTVYNGYTIRARHQSSFSNGAATHTVIIVNGVSDTFTSTTIAGATGVIFNADFSVSTYSAFRNQFTDINTYGGIGVDYIDGFNHTGTGAGKHSFKLTYPVNEAGAEIQYGPFSATQTLYCRTREYFAPAGYPSGIATSGSVGWNNNWPAGQKTARFFTNPSFTTDDGAGGWAYLSEKLADSPEYADNIGASWPESRGFNGAAYLKDIKGYYTTPWRDPEYYGDWTNYAQYDTPINFSSGGTLPWMREGEWYTFERWMVLNSSASANGGFGAADGVWQVRINGVNVINFTNVPWVANLRGTVSNPATGPANGLGGWRAMWFGGNYSQGNASYAHPGSPLDRYISEMYLSTTADWV